MRVKVGQSTHVGVTRSENQDSLLVDSPLFLVADGMGGMRGGGTASQLAVEVMKAHVPQLRDNPDPTEAVTAAVADAHQRIIEEGRARPELQGMGTTLTGVVGLPDGKLLLVHVGDSRAYRLRASAFEMISEDDSFVAELVRAGQLSPEDAKSHPQRSLITKALGAGEPGQLQPSIAIIDARDGDRFLLCSDGLTSMLDDAEIKVILEAAVDPDQTANALVDAANARHSTDNVTVIIVDIVEGGSPGVDLIIPATVTQMGPAETASIPVVTVTTPVIDPPLEMGPEVPSQQRRRPTSRSRKVLIGAVITVLVGLLGFLALRAVLLRNWYVACDVSSNVAVYRGVPSGLIGISVSKLDHVSQPLLPCRLLPADVQALLAEGVTARGMVDADGIVDGYRKRLAPPPSPAPTSATTSSLPISPPLPSAPSRTVPTTRATTTTRPQPASTLFPPTTGG